MLNLKEYRHIPNFLIRNTILKLGRLHIRLHNILTEDETPYLHTHPFFYISIILSGGYSEQILVDKKIKNLKHKKGSIIIRQPKTFHRINRIDNNTKTLFITWKSRFKWGLIPHKDIEIPQEFIKPENGGIYQRLIKDRLVYSKFDKYWFIGKDNIDDAYKEHRYSIYQTDNKFKELLNEK